MAKVDFSVPDDVKKAFDRALKWLLADPEREVETGPKAWDHALALETPEATLVAADARYFAAAAPLGRIVRLADWAPPRGLRTLDPRLRSNPPGGQQAP